METLFWLIVLTSFGTFWFYIRKGYGQRTANWLTVAAFLVTFGIFVEFALIGFPLISLSVVLLTGVVVYLRIT